VIVLLAACGSGDGDGTRPTISASLPSDASIVQPTSPPVDAGTAPAETQPPEQPPDETASPAEETAPPEEAAPPEETAPPQEQPEETAAPGTAPVSNVAPADDGDDALWWPWVLGALVVIGAIVAIARGRRGGPSWQIRSTTLLDEIEQLTSHLAAVTPGGLRAVAQSDAIKLATLRATLRDLVASAPDVNSKTALDGLTASLAALHSAVDAIAMSADPSVQPDGASVSQLATQLHTASASARADLAIRR
jgi:hypothetical protein